MRLGTSVNPRIQQKIASAGALQARRNERFGTQKEELAASAGDTVRQNHLFLSWPIRFGSMARIQRLTKRCLVGFLPHDSPGAKGTHAFAGVIEIVATSGVYYTRVLRVMAVSHFPVPFVFDF